MSNRLEKELKALESELERAQDLLDFSQRRLAWLDNEYTKARGSSALKQIGQDFETEKANHDRLQSIVETLSRETKEERSRVVGIQLRSMLYRMPPEKRKPFLESLMP